MLMLHGGVKDFQLKIAFLYRPMFKFKFCMFARYVEQVRHIILLLNLEKFPGR